MITIREANIDDSAKIYGCIKGMAVHVNQVEMLTATEQDIRDSIFKADSHVSVFVAENDSKDICGYALLFKTFSTFTATANYFMEDLFVFPEYRKMNVGKELMRFIKEFAAKQGAQKVDWNVNKANTSAKEFYDKVGAKVLDYKSIYYTEV